MKTLRISLPHGRQFAFTINTARDGARILRSFARSRGVSVLALDWRIV